ncbi:MAG: tetratricopeptide repeat protein [Planctomyces sp.]|nr:tetratricopeptide repeat protein [Planctomyces sp.]
MTKPVPQPAHAPRPQRDDDRSRRRFWRLWLLIAGLTLLAALFGRTAIVQAQLALGRRSLERGDWAAAREHFQAARAVDPKHGETHFWLARAARKSGDLEVLRTSIENARKHGFRDRERLAREWMLALAETGRIHEVERRLPEMLMRPGEDGPEICSAFVSGYCLRLQFEEALTVLEAWEADYPRDIRPHLHRGRIYAGNEKWPQAESAYARLLEMSPGHAEGLRGLAEAQRGQGRSAEAETTLRELIRRRPEDASGYVHLAELLFDRKDAEQALPLLLKAVELEPAKANSRVLLGKTLTALGRTNEAVEQLQPLVDAWPEDFASRYALAMALRGARRAAEAEDHFRTYAELQQSMPRLEELKRDVRLHPQSPDIRCELGLLVLRHISRSEGVAWLESALQFDAQHAGAHAALAEHYDKIGRRDLAEKHRRSARAATPPPTSGAPSA